MIDVSVVIPTFNRFKSLQVALNSVFAQQNLNIECIVVDDGSTDGTANLLLDQYQYHNLVVIQNTSRSGAQVSRNLGIAKAQGDFVTFLDSDDYLEPNTLASRVKRCREASLDALFSGYRVRYLGRKWELVKNINTSARYCPHNYATALCNFKIAPMITIMYRRTAHLYLRLDENLLSGHDDDLSLYLIRCGRFEFDDVLAATIMQHSGERIATTRNLMIGNAQLLEKYASDIIMNHGVSLLMRSRAKAMAGLWSVGYFKQTAELYPLKDNYGTTLKVLCLSVLNLPSQCIEILRKNFIKTLLKIFL